MIQFNKLLRTKFYSHKMYAIFFATQKSYSYVQIHKKQTHLEAKTVHWVVAKSFNSEEKRRVHGGLVNGHPSHLQ